MAVKKERLATAVDPDRTQLTPLQAERLAAMSDVAARELVGLSVAEIRDKFRFQIDATLLAFRKICGRVVKKNPITGVEYPVPYATVHVEDSDCSLLGFFPSKAKWAWYFPFACRREVIATAKTDECGRFCVWIPRWDIDWVLRFRRERVCFPIVFDRPSVRDLLDDLIPQRIPRPIPEPDPPPFGPRPGPGPDPAPLLRFDRARLVRHIEDQIGRDVAKNLDLLETQATFGASTVELSTLLESAAFEQEVPPPLPMEFRVGPDRGGQVKAESRAGMETVRSSLATRLRLDAATLKGVDLRKYIGPFRRCFDVFIPEWSPILDVPDITFRVTQDTDGDGTEETIYGEGYFQVRWNASGPIGPIKITAQPNAREGLECDGNPVPCADVPAIVLAGRMPVVNVPAIYDPINGYALRPNRPHPSGLFADPLPNPDAASPFMGAVSLLGCNRTDPAATHYRIVYRYSADGGVTFTSPAPFVGLTWPLFRLDGSGNPEFHYPTSDANGWYPIALPPGPNPFLPQDLLLDWPTYAFANGRYVLQLELGTGGAASSSSAEVAFNIDNAAPLGPLTVEWRKVGSGAFQPLVAPCPLVRRGVTPADLEFRVTVSAAATHLRSALLAAGGCGGGEFEFVSGTTEHWHTSPSDNAEVLQAIFRLPSTTLEGTYGFSARVSSRAFNPNGGDGGHLILPDPWEYDPEPVHIDPSFAFSVINAN
jgi:hypothetical protein